MESGPLGDTRCNRLERTLQAPRPERRDTENDTMFGMDMAGLLLIAAILLIWTACLWKLGGSMVAALILGSILGSFVGLLVVALSAARTTRRNRAVAIRRLSAMA